jgi:hypothetical protein
MPFNEKRFTLMWVEVNASTPTARMITTRCASTIGSGVGVLSCDTQSAALNSIWPMTESRTILKNSVARPTTDSLFWKGVRVGLTRSERLW